MNKFLLDANVFIESAKRYYAFDLVPGFWTNLTNFNKAGEIYSIDKIEKEILKGKRSDESMDENHYNSYISSHDSLIDWITNDFQLAFLNSDQDDVNKTFALLMKWSISSSYSDIAKRDFASKADAWLIAYALSKSYTVVTDEKNVYSPGAVNKIKIPNVCREFKLECINTFEMLRRLQVKLR